MSISIRQSLRTVLSETWFEFWVVPHAALRWTSWYLSVPPTQDTQCSIFQHAINTSSSAGQILPLGNLVQSYPFSRIVKEYYTRNNWFLVHCQLNNHKLTYKNLPSRLEWVLYSIHSVYQRKGGKSHSSISWLTLNLQNSIYIFFKPITYMHSMETWTKNKTQETQESLIPSEESQRYQYLAERNPHDSESC